MIRFDADIAKQFITTDSHSPLPWKHSAHLVFYVQHQNASIVTKIHGYSLPRWGSDRSLCHPRSTEGFFFRVFQGSKGWIPSFASHVSSRSRPGQGIS